MKVIGALSWFEESPVWLAALVASGSGFFDHFVAVDGAYFLYPDALKHPSSGPEQAEAIIQTAAACGIGCSVHVPAEPWAGNETEKRSFLFQACQLVAEPNVDWVCVVDGDDLLNRVPFDAKQRLEQTDLDVAEVSLWWREDWEATAAKAARAQWHATGGPPDEWSVTHRALFRAIPGLRCGYAHMIYETPDGRRLRGQLDDDRQPLEPALDLTDLRVEHRHAMRNPARRQLAQDYYRRRTDLGVEARPADDRRAHASLAVAPRPAAG